MTREIATTQTTTGLLLCVFLLVFLSPSPGWMSLLKNTRRREVPLFIGAFLVRHRSFLLGLVLGALNHICPKQNESYMATEHSDYHLDAHMSDRGHISGTPLFGGG